LKEDIKLYNQFTNFGETLIFVDKSSNSDAPLVGVTETAEEQGIS